LIDAKSVALTAVSDNPDDEAWNNVRARAMRAGDPSGVVADPECWRLFDRTATAIKGRDADVDLDAIAALNDAIVRDARRGSAKKRGTAGVKPRPVQITWTCI
jgi:hypothetical protein